MDKMQRDGLKILEIEQYPIFGVRLTARNRESVERTYIGDKKHPTSYPATKHNSQHNGQQQYTFHGNK